MLPAAAVEHYRDQQRRSVAAMALARREWARMGPDFDASWASVGPRLFLLVASAQLGAAQAGAAYVPVVLSQLDREVEALGQVDPHAFAGVASDGRDLDGLLYSAVTTAKQQVGQGASQSQALSAGGSALDMYVQTLVADAGRGAASVAIAARPRVGYVRMLNPPSCSRCAVLAGKFYRYSAGFRRHPRCDCVHIPATEDVAGDLRTNPLEAIRAGQVTGLSAADTKAILEDGADVSQVINAHRGMSVAQVYGERLKITSEGMTSRGFAGQRIGARQGTRRESAGTATRITRNGPEQRAITRTVARGVRPMPESLYDIATDRADAIRLLKLYGYII